MKFLLLTTFTLSFISFSPLWAKDSFSVYQKIETNSCQFLTGKEHAISFQVGMNFKTIDMIIPPKTKTWKSYDCYGQKVGVIVYEFANPKEANEAAAFVKGNIWGTSGPTPQHPERIYVGENLVVIVSSTSKTSLDDSIAQSLKYNLPQTLDFNLLIQFENKVSLFFKRQGCRKYMTPFSFTGTCQHPDDRKIVRKIPNVAEKDLLFVRREGKTLCGAKDEKERKKILKNYAQRPTRH